MLSDKHKRNAHLLSDPSDQPARGVPDQEALARAPLWLMMMKAFPSGNGCWDPRQADGNYSRRLAWSPQVSICPSPLLGHHPMVTSLLDRSEVIIRPMKDGNGKRTFKIGPIVTMSCNSWDSHTKNQTNRMPRNKTLPFLVCLASKLCSNLPQAPVAPNGWRTYSTSILKPHEDVLTCEPEPEVAPTQSMEEPFAHPTPPHSIITIDNMTVTSPSPFSFPDSATFPSCSPSLQVPPRTPPPPPLIPTMALDRNLPTYYRP
ncbi:hypothetical protein O181_016318 [Austropuccinia psidii MF-1]|uniref:Uncharacterized protein n=1 Tax=Austropuccinia psidii MF-1 TaxID=1389203 RepID=A0A9Q3GQR5_9BASI|nr:hypothetical protein [Austropuccinia psidii MF-1]